MQLSNPKLLLVRASLNLKRHLSKAMQVKAIQTIHS